MYDAAIYIPIKPLDTFWTEQKLKYHRFTSNLQGLQKLMVKDSPWSIIPYNALLFEKTLKQFSILDIEDNKFILNTCHDTAKQGWVFTIFSPNSDDRLSLNFHRFVILYIYKLWYTKFGPWIILFTESVQWL